MLDTSNLVQTKKNRRNLRSTNPNPGGNHEEGVFSFIVDRNLFSWILNEEISFEGFVGIIINSFFEYFFYRCYSEQGNICSFHIF